ncbi:MAG TPA: DinB family protein, partial [Polyangiales bacterium]|nr:DinB family protein [Polyangiales bacterium]
QGYNEAAFAELPDHRMPVEWSLDVLEGVHARWVSLLNSMSDAQWQRTWNHSERGVQRLDFVTLLYAWHCRHHVAHITHLRAQRGW